jgi:hypothetical protein
MTDRLLPDDHDELLRRIERDLIDGYDEELELEIEDRSLDVLGPSTEAETQRAERHRYFRELFRLQGELVKLQDWVAYTRHKVVILFEGRDAAGKGGVDLLQRKLLGREAEAFAALLSELRKEAEGSGDDGRPLATQIEAAQHAMAMVRDRAARDAEAPLRVADDFLAGVAYLLMAWAWTASLRAAESCTAEDLAPAERAIVARHGLDWLLPQSAVHWQRVNAALPLGRLGA